MEKDADPNYYEIWKAAMAEYHRPDITPAERQDARETIMNAIVQGRSAFII